MQNTTYKIPPKSLLMQDGSDCVLGIVTVDVNKKLPPDWIILGVPFFKDFVTSINYETSSFSYALSKKANAGATVGPTPTPIPPHPDPPGPDPPGPDPPGPDPDPPGPGPTPVPD